MLRGMVEFGDPIALSVILLALFLGGVLKGATGVGVPLVAVPVIAAFYDVRIAVVIMVTPNFLTNIWQVWNHRTTRLPQQFGLRFALAGAVGAFLGTVMLATFSVWVLQLIMAGIIVVYVTLRLARPAMQLAFERALQVVLPVGFASGVLQGAAGISAPISVSFLNAMRLDRPVFIHTITGIFVSMSLIQIPSLFAYGMMTPALLGLGALAVVPLLLGMPIGGWIARRISAKTFDRIMLGFLTILAARLCFAAFV